MSRTTKPQWDDPEESKRFLETAKKVEASEDPQDFRRALKAIAQNCKRILKGS